MSRSGYSDDYDGDGYPLEFYRKAVENAARGKRGQVFFRDLLASLDAMPVKRLVSDDLVTKGGEVCAFGALGLARGLDMSRLNPDDAERVGSAFNVATSLAREVVFENDENGSKTVESSCKYCHGWGEATGVSRWSGNPVLSCCSPCSGRGRVWRRVRETPEARWIRMRAWVASNIKPEPRA